MTRSQFAIKRLLVVPYGALLILYIAVLGGGGAWLYLQVRAVEARLLVDEILAVVEPLAEQLDALERVVATARDEPDLIAALRGLFGDLPALTRIAVQDRAGGFVLTGARGPDAEPRTTGPRPARALPAQPPAQRLLAEPGREFRLAYELGGERPPARLALTFDRSMLLARVREALASVRRAILSFVLGGTLGILVALGITAVAMDRTRRIEAHFQELYRRASLTGLAAELVHDLKNPLMALRANVKALMIAPDQSATVLDRIGDSKSWTSAGARPRASAPATMAAASGCSLARSRPQYHEATPRRMVRRPRRSRRTTRFVYESVGRKRPAKGANCSF